MEGSRFSVPLPPSDFSHLSLRTLWPPTAFKDAPNSNRVQNFFRRLFSGSNQGNWNSSKVCQTSIWMPIIFRWMFDKFLTNSSVPDSGKKKAQKHKLFDPVGLGTTPGMSRWQTGLVLILHTGSPICPRDKPSLSPGTIPGTKGSRKSSCVKSLTVRVKIITGSLVILENLFPKNYRYRYCLEIPMNSLITITVTVLASAVTPAFPLIPNYHLESYLN